ncbi:MULTISPECIES: ferredoxin--NADP reductase [Psychrobacter]|uniref:ferredoxin--NADP reductase n=1 Tax=Psychrobacter TaxID=497 RepID=UPI00086F154E|nr:MULTISPECIES: ferredoxin--NADP reductase [Psychrobacter]MBA6245083.1 ferredoxin--NADP reductase [Psychrobacter sp. Urea-trap-18]MBA6286686.1 ferredoxin--NADP reductase [Psychrobacter sp. Urea-trap-16]MBA6317855.1 ferredoxin--NADP reductase [Psychrobacter sp. Urea-trap-20]MBA6334410.1 ferredoxin--NADP reductase [Psychrobacter sp. Urea-trap-19]OEH68432.1 MAG: ferredoxin--NADP(+) reductase [Psychrobacter sp. B29-1]|tara:strand:+ start:20148 stop:20975 length:828 start_codon:yes stop_codon:yes gene_type:complete
MSDNIQTVTVLSKTTWTPNLFSFTVSRPDSFKFTAGQFVRLGVNPSQLKYYQQTDASDETADSALNEDVFRAYSIVSSPFDEVIEFFSIVIPDGAFTSQLQHLQVGDELLLNTMPFGFLTLARYQKPLPKDLWLLATGTGLAPFLSMLQDLKTWEDYEHIVLAYSARSLDELAYVEKIESLQEDFGTLVDNPAKLIFIPIVTREPVEGALSERLPKLLLEGTLQARAGIALDIDTTHVMLCGNPDMVEDTKEALKTLGLVMNRRGEGNIAVENYW